MNNISLKIVLTLGLCLLVITYKAKNKRYAKYQLFVYSYFSAVLTLFKAMFKYNDILSPQNNVFLFFCTVFTLYIVVITIVWLIKVILNEQFSLRDAFITTTVFILIIGTPVLLPYIEKPIYIIESFVYFFASIYYLFSGQFAYSNSGVLLMNGPDSGNVDSTGTASSNSAGQTTNNTAVSNYDFPTDQKGIDDRSGKIRQRCKNTLNRLRKYDGAENIDLAHGNISTMTSSDLTRSIKTCNTMVKHLEEWNALKRHCNSLGYNFKSTVSLENNEELYDIVYSKLQARATEIYNNSSNNN